MGSKQRLKRSRSIRAFDRADSTVVLDRFGEAREFKGTSALLVRELLSALREPRTQEELLAHLDGVAEGAAGASAVVGQALDLLQKAGAVAPWSAPAMAATRAVQGRIVLGVSGAVGASHAPALVAGLQQRGFELRVALTRSAHKFVAPAVLRALTHQRVHSSLWAGRPDAPAPHLDLAEWADVVVVAPATATTIARIRNGNSVRWPRSACVWLSCARSSSSAVTSTSSI